MWLTKHDSKQGILVEKLKAEIIDKLGHQTAAASRKLVQLDTSISGLTQAIEDVESKKFEAETRLQQLQDHTEPGKKTLDSISALIIEIQALKQTYENWAARLGVLQTERAGLLHGVKQEVDQIFNTIRADLQSKVDAEASNLLAFLVLTEMVLEECRRVDCYIPYLKGVSDAVPHLPHLSHCKPRELVRYLHKTAPWWTCSSN